MKSRPHYRIRTAKPDEYTRIGALVADAYASLSGMASPQAQPEYYDMLRNVGARAGNPNISVFAAVDSGDTLLGSVDFIHDLQHYGSGGSAGSVPDSAGIRLLAVVPAARGLGIGKALTHHCLAQARQLGRSQVILHTTKAMQTAWQMYAAMGFERFPQIDFQQGELEVFGFRLPLN